jgi:hypothetical protein
MVVCSAVPKGASVDCPVSLAERLAAPGFWSQSLNRPHGRSRLDIIDIRLFDARKEGHPDDHHVHVPDPQGISLHIHNDLSLFEPSDLPSRSSGRNLAGRGRMEISVHLLGHGDHEDHRRHQSVSRACCRLFSSRCCENFRNGSRFPAPFGIAEDDARTADDFSGHRCRDVLP